MPFGACESTVPAAHCPEKDLILRIKPSLSRPWSRRSCIQYGWFLGRSVNKSSFMVLIGLLFMRRFKLFLDQVAKRIPPGDWSAYQWLELDFGLASGSSWLNAGFDLPPAFWLNDGFGLLCSWIFSTAFSTKASSSSPGSNLCGACGHKFRRICTCLFAHGHQDSDLSFTEQRPFTGVLSSYQCFCIFALFGCCIPDLVSKNLPWGRHSDTSLADNNRETKRTKRIV